MRDKAVERETPDSIRPTTFEIALTPLRGDANARLSHEGGGKLKLSVS